MSRVFLLIATLLVVALSPCRLQAQSTRRVTAEYDYIVPEDVTSADAKRIAIERAKLKAIEEEFGSVVYQDNSTIIKNSSGSSSVDFLSLGGSNIKGEWLEDLDKPTTEMVTEDGNLIIRARVRGRIREIVRAEINIEAKVLRDGTTVQSESYHFISGNTMYLSFQSPRDGYLTVYLLDKNGDAFRLLPYQRSPREVFTIRKDSPYTLFNMSASTLQERPFVDEYILTAESESEVNYLYIIFSPNEFTKANDAVVGSETTPSQLPFEDFQKWLSKNRIADAEMQVISRSIEIRKP